MLFYSFDFAIFLPVVFGLYWLIEKKSWQNSILVISSYIFYGWWDWRFLFLILLSTMVDFYLGRKIEKTYSKFYRKLFLISSVFVNIGLLALFKYYNFFIESFATAFSFFGLSIQFSSLDIILPIGISFYTFQTLSYTIDIYNDRIRSTSNFITFSAFVSFFPQLVAGPIERAKNLLPQFNTVRNFDRNEAIDGLRQVLWGFFKKIVIANNCAVFSDFIFNNSGNFTGSTILLGTIFFSFQIYADFSGYSDIAIGTAKFFGVNLMQNFAFPYFSRSISEFWRRWHISLSTWFRDYVYIPIGGSRNGKIITIRNILIVFILSALWHGAKWTFILWGILHALAFIPVFIIRQKNSRQKVVAYGKNLPTIFEFFEVLSTFTFISLSWIFFRSSNINQAINFISKLFSSSLFSIPNYIDINLFMKTIALLTFFIGIEWWGRTNKYAIETFGWNWKRKYRLLFYYSLILMIYMFAGGEEQFIYFQF